MSTDVPTLDSTLNAAVASGQLLEAARDNIHALLSGTPSKLYSEAVDELVAAGAWSELNDRFYKTLAFGTGGLRGRTIGKVVTAAERGNVAPDKAPQYPCVGTNAMNFYNINRATRGLVTYLTDWFAQHQLTGRPKIVMADEEKPPVSANHRVEACAKSERGSSVRVDGAAPSFSIRLFGPFEVALLDGWVRFWYQGELLPLPADLERALEQERHRADEATHRADEANRRADEATRQAAELQRRLAQAEQELAQFRAFSHQPHPRRNNG